MPRAQNRMPGVEISRISSSGREETDLSSIQVERVPESQMIKLFTERQDKITELPKMNKSSLQISFTGRDRTGNKYTTVSSNKMQNRAGAKKNSSLSPVSNVNS